MLPKEPPQAAHAQECAIKNLLTGSARGWYGFNGLLATMLNRCSSQVSLLHIASSAL